jgi:hypothetical protein
MKNKSLYRIINLTSGDNIIGQITNKESKSITVYRPYQMKIITLMDPVSDSHAFRQEALVMRNWLELSEEEQVKIPTDQVIAITRPTDKVSMHYNEEMEKEDNPTFMEDLLNKLNEEGVGPDDMSEEEFLENATISIDPEHIKDIIEKILNDAKNIPNLEGYLKDEDEDDEEYNEEYYDTDKDMYGW